MTSLDVENREGGMPANAVSHDGVDTPRRLDASSIYPTPKEAHTESTSEPREPSVDQWPQETRSDKLIKAIIRGGGILTIILGFASIILPIVITGNLIAGLTGVVGALIGTLVGWGLILRKELARLGVIMLVVISVVSLVVGLSGYFGQSFMPNSQIRCSSASECQSKAQAVRSSRMHTEYLAALIFGGLADIGIVVFLTRPIVKRQFS